MEDKEHITYCVNEYLENNIDELIIKIKEREKEMEDNGIIQEQAAPISTGEASITDVEEILEQSASDSETQEEQAAEPPTIPVHETFTVQDNLNGQNFLYTIDVPTYHISKMLGQMAFILNAVNENLSSFNAHMDSHGKTFDGMCNRLTDIYTALDRAK